MFDSVGAICSRYPTRHRPRIVSGRDCVIAAVCRRDIRRRRLQPRLRARSGPVRA